MAALVCVAFKFSFAFAAVVGSFGEFQLASFNGAKGDLVVSNQTLHLSNSAGDETSVTFAFQPFAGSGQIIARIDRSTGTSAKAGLIFRGITNSVSRYAGIFLSGSNIVFERLLKTNEPAISTVKTNITADWLRIVREGDAVSGFYSADGTNWTQLSADTVGMREEIAAGFESIGKRNAMFNEVQMTSTRLVSPANNASFTVPTNIWIRADVKALGCQPERVEFFADTKKLGMASEPPFQLPWTNALAGERSISAKVTGSSHAEFFAGPVNCTIKLPARRLTFIGADSATKGDWKGTYGKEGFVIPNDGRKIPEYANVILAGCKPVTWADSVGDNRALDKSDSEKKIASTWHSQRPFEIKLDIADGRQHQFSLYCLDWDQTGRVESVEILDPGTEKVLDSRTLASFSRGKYLAWSCNGPVKIRVTAKKGNASISGLFFDPTAKEK